MTAPPKAWDMPSPTNLKFDTEMIAMQRVFRALASLSPEARSRVLYHVRQILEEE